MSFIYYTAGPELHTNKQPRGAHHEAPTWSCFNVPERKVRLYYPLIFWLPSHVGKGNYRKFMFLLQRFYSVSLSLIKCRRHPPRAPAPGQPAACSAADY